MFIRRNIYIVCILAVFPWFASAEDLTAQIGGLMHADEPVRQIQRINEILQHNPTIEALFTAISNIEYKPQEAGKQTRENLCIDGVMRRYYVYVPKNYDHQKKNPLLVYLHGGVMRRELVEDWEIEDFELVNLAEEYGYILLFPLGQFGASWWDTVGITNVLQQVRRTKQDFNIDDNRVFMMGFSDGASGSFNFAMCYPTDFAGFMPCNGHPGVGSSAGMHTYFVNLANRPVYVINTDEDELYPAEKKIRPMMNLANEAGANLLYRIYTGIGHDFDYLLIELPLMARFMENHPRSLNSSITWESADPGRQCMWLSIDSITDEGYADWHKDYNMKLTDDRVMFGFMPDDYHTNLDYSIIDTSALFNLFEEKSFQGPGVRVDNVVGDSSLCALTGIQAGDIIVKLDDKAVHTLDDVNECKQGKQRGDSVYIAILRNGEVIEFNTAFPEPTIFDLFTREKPSGRVEGYFCANRFTLRTSQVGALTLYLHPAMVQFDQNVVVEVNGQVLYDQPVEPSPGFLLHTFSENWDRELLYVNKIRIKL
jgi:poly(3-hydroxybutyrate) depolymerase